MPGVRGLYDLRIAASFCSGAFCGVDWKSRVWLVALPESGGGRISVGYRSRGRV